MEEIFKELDSKFESWHPTQDYYKYKKWWLHRYQYYGADYGIELLYWTEKKLWVMRQMLESGYVEGKILLESDTFSDIEPWITVLAPTNDNYKTDRK